MSDQDSTATVTELPHKPGLETADPFNPSAFAAPPAQELIAAERLLVTCKVGNPAKDAFVRASDDPQLTLEAFILKLESTGEISLLTPDAAMQVAESAKRVRLTVAIDRQGNPFVWLTHPVPTDGKDNAWHQSMRQAIELAKQQWVRVQSNMAAGGYDVMAASVAIPEPEWPKYSMPDYLGRIRG